MLLGLASGNTFLDTADGSGVGNMTAMSPEFTAVAKQAFYDFGERPIWAERVTYGTSELCRHSLHIPQTLSGVKVMLRERLSSAVVGRGLLSTLHVWCSQFGRLK
jgi:hypothetical protein